MKIGQICRFSYDFISLFNKNIYEAFVLEIMNLSKIIFPNSYSMVTDQSAGQCDFIDNKGEKYDAKLPFNKEQIKLLTDGKKHKPEIKMWVNEIYRESAEYNPILLRDNPESIEKLKLYKIMKEQIFKDKDDESIIFFYPYTISLSYKDNILSQLGADYISAIFDRLKEEIDLADRKIYIIYPSSEKNYFVLRSTDETYYKEYVYYDKTEKYFSYEVVDVDVSKEQGN